MLFEDVCDMIGLPCRALERPVGFCFGLGFVIFVLVDRFHLCVIVL